EAEDHVGVVRRGRPDLLAVDDEVVAVLDRRGAERGQVRARLWLRIALAPDDLAAQRRGDPAALLLLGAELEQRRRQHRDALVRQAGWQAGVGELLGDDARREDVWLGAVSTVFAWNGARRIAVLDEQALPCARIARRSVEAERLRGQVTVRSDEGLHLRTQGTMLGTVGQVHVATPSGNAMSSRAGRPRVHARFAARRRKSCGETPW